MPHGECRLSARLEDEEFIKGSALHFELVRLAKRIVRSSLFDSWVGKVNPLPARSHYPSKTDNLNLYLNLLRSTKLHKLRLNPSCARFLKVFQCR